ncbi:hypothetical protein DWUX_2726 [Desulfovibrio diazotrophicus]|nr:hypothetical protein DWUX_2726 [Desulfovibrio diazotrophicus]
MSMRGATRRAAQALKGPGPHQWRLPAFFAPQPGPCRQMHRKVHFKQQ